MRRGAAIGALFAALGAVAAIPGRTLAQRPAAPPAGQNPSPMRETSRAHERLVPRELPGTARSFTGPAGRAVAVRVPAPSPSTARGEVDLVIHFHGAVWLAEQAVAALADGSASAVLDLGAGSGAYDRAFADPAAFDSLLAGIAREITAVRGASARIGRLTLVGFSAGHGAVRAILRDPRHFARVDAVLLLDGMHTSYAPEGRVLADAGALDTTNLLAFAGFARAAVRGEKRFVVTHSEIFPGTFASTTETADWLLDALGLRRTAVLRWGPRGMQQLSEVRAGGFEMLGFAGNSAPDHIDHFHALPEMLGRVRPLLVERDDLDLGLPLDVEVHDDAPGIAADLAVLDVLLLVAPTRVERDLHRFAAVRTDHGGFGLGVGVAEFAFVVDIVVGHG